MDTQNINALLQRTAELERELAVKNRELQIEAALDRVRACTMAMQKSNELKNVIAAVFEKLKALEVVFDASGIFLFKDNSDDMVSWVANPDVMSEPLLVDLPYEDALEKSALFKNIQKARTTGEDIYNRTYSFEEKNKYFEYVWKYNPQTPSNVKAFQLQAPSYTHTVVMRRYSALVADSWSGKTFTVEEVHVLKRLGSVFEQAYVRFLDLKQAEAQAREAQIEAALEKVRSRSLAMHSSSELKDVVQVIFEKLQELDFVLEDGAVCILIFKEGSKNHVQWIADPRQAYATALEVPYTDQTVLTSFLQARESGADFFSKIFPVEEKNTYFNYLFEQTGYRHLPNDVKKLILGSEHYGFSVAFAKTSAILIPTTSGRLVTEDKKETLKRFATVFDQAYTRFLDLQRAEAQTREAQIQLALERVRARALAMQTSDDLIEVANVLREQMGTLGQPELESSIVHLYNGDSETFDVWYAYASPHHSGGTITGFGTVAKNASEWTREVIAKYQSAETEYTIVSSGEKLREWYSVLETFARDTIEYDDSGQMNVPEILYYHFSKFSGGALLMISNQQPSQESRELQKRAAAVFDLAYTRFLDLKQAEAQAREAQIQLALERVRARTMAMQKSEELADVATLLFEQVAALGIKAWTTGFNVWSDDNNYYTDYVTSPQGNFIEPYTIDASEFPAFKEVSDARKRGETFYVSYLEGELLKRTYQELSKFGDKQQYEKMVEGGFQFPERQFNHFVFGSRVSLMFITYKPVLEAHDIFIRFGNVFEQTYTRFLDLQRAEAQAIRAEQDLVEIKAARKKAEDTLAALKATQQQLIQAEKMASLGELTAGIAHEIQNPLNFVNNFSETNTELLEELKQQLENGHLEEANAIASDVISNEQKINHHGKRAEAIVRNMLQHSRASKGEKQLTDFNALADEYLRLAYHGFRAKDKSFNAVINTSFDATIGNINIVPQEIGRVLLNVFNNAFYAVHERLKKLSDGYEPTVSICTRKVDENVELVVEDNGMGISKSLQDKIFQPFFTTKPTGEGTGLGLSLSYDIIKAHGGELLVESVECEGTTFTVQLPHS